MKIKARKNIFILITILGIIASISFSIKDTQGYLPVEFYPGESFTWEIDGVSEGTNFWWNNTVSDDWMDWNLIGEWYAEISDEVSFSVTDSLEKDSKKYLIGNLDIGNLSITTNDYDIGFNLAFSANLWYGGLISLEEDWSSLASQNPFNEENASIQVNYKTNILGLEVNTIRIAYNDSIQSTVLLYEKSTGILISANTTVLSFSLELHLTSSSIPLPTVTNGLPFPGVSCFISAIITMSIFAKIKRRR